MSQEQHAAATSAKSIFDSQHYAFENRSPRSDSSGAFDSQPSSRRPSSQKSGLSPVYRQLPMMTQASSSADPSSGLTSVAENRFESGDQQSDTHSMRSSTSSLRQAYDALKGGIFPPGMRSASRGDDDAGSDGSHYDDEDGYIFEGGGPFQSPDSPQLVMSNAAQASDIYSNALDSPDVPQRRSSVHHSAAPTVSRQAVKAPSSATSSLRTRVDLTARPSMDATTSVHSRTSSHTDIGVASTAGQQSTLRGGHQRHAQSIGEPDLTSPERIVGSPTSPLRQEERPQNSETIDNGQQGKDAEDVTEMERRLEAEAAATAGDPSRPRTLKEARALAKERARLRMQAKGNGESIDDLGSPSNSALPLRQGSVSHDPPTTDSQRQEHRHVQVVPSLLQGSKRPPVLARTGLDSRRPSVPVDVTESGDGTLEDMSDLQAAVGEALEDVSFASSATSTAANGRASGAATASGSARHDPNNLLHPTSTPFAPMDTDVDSNAASVQSFDSAPESPTSRSSPFVSAVQMPGISAQADVIEDSSEGQPPTIQVIHSSNHLQQGSAFGKPKRVKPGATHVDPLATPTAQHFVPHPLQAQQRATAPNKIARLDVFGKSIPWPAAFDPTAIIEQRRLAPWERARSYAHYCNDLTHTSTGLQIWLEMVQRPAQRAAAASGAVNQNAQTKRHLRVEGTEGSSYAASVSSDATFPMRGDGGKAKEILAHHPSEASIPESPTSLPQNLPYPMLASNQPQHQASFSSPSARHQARPSQDSLSGLASIGQNSNDRRDPRTFFTSLGRKTSMRRSPGSGSISTSAFSTHTPSKGAISSIRSRGISVPTAASTTSLKSTPSDFNAASPQDAYSTPVSSPLPSSQSISASSPGPSPGMASTASSASFARNGPQGPRALGNTPSYFNSLSSAPRSDSMSSLSPVSSSEKPGLHGVSTGGGIYSIPQNANSSTKLALPTDYSSHISPVGRSPRSATTPLPAVTSAKNSLSYSSVRDPTKRPTLQPPALSNSGNSSDSVGSERRGSSTSGTSFTLTRRRSSNLAPPPVTRQEEETLDKLCDVLPDADRSHLLEYLRRANGNDLVAIGDYLQDQSKAEQSKHLR